MLPGQFARDSRGRLAYHFFAPPISINYVDRQRNEVWFLIQLVGDGTKRLGEAKAGDIINVVLPLGNCFTMPEKPLRQALIGRWRCRYSSYVIFRRTARQKRLQTTNIPAGCQKTKICFNWNNLPPMARCIPPPKMAATEKKGIRNTTLHIK